MEGKSHYFELKDFSIEMRASTKDFLNLIGRSHVALKRHSKDIMFQKEEQVKRLLEQEEKLKDILKFQEFDTAVKRIQFLLKNGAIPRSELPEFFAAKKTSKLKYREQLMMEYENVMEFVMLNLPPDFEEAKANAKKQNQDVIDRRLEGQREAQKRKEENIKERAEKKNFEWAAREAKQQQDQEKEDSKKKLKKIIIKKTDKEGWVTEKTTLVDSITGEPDKPSKPEKGKKGEKGEKKSQNKPLKVKVQPPQEVSRATLQANPFAPSLEEDAYESRAETQHKKIMQKSKGKDSNKEKIETETQPPPQQQPQSQPQQQKSDTKQTNNTTKQKTAAKPKPPKPATQKPSNQQKEIPLKKSEEKPAEIKKKPKTEEKEEKDETKQVDQKKLKKIVRQSKPKAFYEYVWFQPLVIIFAVLAIVGLSYVFVFS